MDATALRTSTQAVTTGTRATATATTNGPSSGAPVAGGGPVAASSNGALLGTHLLPAPAGQPQPIHLPDGSVLVPLAIVDGSGRQLPLTQGGALAPSNPTTSGGGPAPSVAMNAPVVTAPAGGARTAAFEPKGFLYNDLYFAKFHDAKPIDLNDRDAVERRMAKSTMAYLLEEEPEVDDFGIREIRVRRADPARDQDLLTVNPRSHWVADVVGVDGTTGTPKDKVIPLVMNSDGAVFVDPRVRSR